MTTATEVIKNENPQLVYLKNYTVPDFLISEIELHFDLNDDITIVKSEMKIHKNPESKNKNNKLILNGEALHLESIKLDGVKINPSQYQLAEEVLILEAVPDHFELEIITHIQPQLNTTLSGLFCSQKKYCTQCESQGFRRITYFIDRPDVLAQYTTTIEADASLYPILLSNGNLIASGTLPNNRHWAKWQDPFKKPSYLFALVAGDFDLLSDQFKTQSGRLIDLRIYVEKGYGHQADHAMYSVKTAMRWDENHYGREYDLDIYMIAAMSDFNMGAMENKGLNVFNTKYILAAKETATDDDYVHIMSVIAHEYFHNWTGNRITCRDWFQLSLKEGLTIFRDQSFTEDTFSKSVARIREVNSLREVQFPEDASPVAHSVRPDSYMEISNFYTSTIYNKGAEVLRMLQTILGPDLFRKGMDLYFKRHDGQAVTIEDYVKVMEDVSGQDFTQFRLWYSQAGTPVIDIEDDYDENKKIYTLSINQSCPATPNQPEKLPMHIPIRLGLFDNDGKAIPFSLDDNKLESEKVLHLKNASQIIRINQIPSRPIPSFLRNFSAPVKSRYYYADSDLQLLLKHDTDPFNRWNAGQKYAEHLILSLTQDHRHQNELIFPVEIIENFNYVFRVLMNDKLLLAEMLNLPSEKYLGEQMEVIDVEAIHVARECMMQGISEHLQTVFYDVYNENHNGASSGVFNIEEIGRRQLKNSCLSYLMRLPKTSIHEEMGMRQFESSLTTNMTDTIAALTALSHIDSPLRERALNQFYTVWKDDALVVDKWFAIQAASNLPSTLKQVKKLMRHEAFDIKNPNKVYALIGTFTHRNLVQFHAENGEGYAFLREVVLELDKLNPQIAARMVKPLTTWNRYDKERQTLMRDQLELIVKTDHLSKDTYELASMSLK